MSDQTSACAVLAASLAAAILFAPPPSMAQPSAGGSRPGGGAAPAVPDAPAPAITVTLRDAHMAFDPSTGDPVVSITFDEPSRRRFADFTRTHVGITVEFILDGQVLTSPTIQTPIEGGIGQIYGVFTTAEATRLATRLREPGVQLVIRPRPAD